MIKDMNARKLCAGTQRGRRLLPQRLAVTKYGDPHFANSRAVIRHSE
jgi:hypothetical protein